MSNNDGFKIPEKLTIDPNNPYLSIDEMIFELSGGDITKADYVSNNYDIDDYVLWLAFQSRKNKIEKAYIEFSKKSNS